MDFHTLSRKELQTLCKKNKIPANITNLAMANALSSLPQVEGLDEFLNSREGDAGTPIVNHRTSQRKPVRGEAEGSNVKVVSARLQRGTRGRGIAEGVVEQEENKDANLPFTPAIVPGSKKRTTHRKKDAEKLVVEDDNGDDGKNEVQGKVKVKPIDVPITPAAAPSSRARRRATKTETPSGTSVQRAYNTRRSVRALEKNLSKMNLVDTEYKVDDVSEELSNVSQQVEDCPSETGKGASLQAMSTQVSENTTHEFEVSSLEKNTEDGCRSHHDLSSDVELVSAAENDTVDGLQAEPQERDEPPKDNFSDSGPLGSSYDSNETGSELLPVIEESCEVEIGNKECFGVRQDKLPVEASENVIPEVTVQDVDLNVEDVSVEVEASGDVIQEVAVQDVDLIVDDGSVDVEASEDVMQEAAVQDVYLTVVVPEDVSEGVTDQDVDGSLSLSSVDVASVSLKELVKCSIDDEGSSEGDDNQDENKEPQEETELDGSANSDSCEPSEEAGSETLPVLQEFCDSSELEMVNKEHVRTMQNGLPVEESKDAPVQVTVMEPDDVPMGDTKKDADGFVPMLFVDGNTDDENQDKYNVNEQLNESRGSCIHNSEPVHDVDEKAAEEKDLASSEEVLEPILSTFSPSAEHQVEEFEAKSDVSEESVAETDEINDVSDILEVDKDASAEEKESTLESSVMDVEAEDSKNNSENFEAEAEDEETDPEELESLGTEVQSEESNSEEGASDEDTVVVADHAFSSSAEENESTLESSVMDVEAEAQGEEADPEDLESSGAGVQSEESVPEELESLGAEVQSEESVPEERAAGEDTVLVADPQAPLVHQQVSVESGESYVDSYSADRGSLGAEVQSEESFPEERAAGEDTVLVADPQAPLVHQQVSVESEDIAIPKEEPIQKQKTDDVSIEAVVSDQLKGDMKENLTTEELMSKSKGELRRMLKKLTLDDDKINSKADYAVKETKKRTALQALPQNQMTEGEAQN
ncbi:hypothetical protein RJT34_31629 [Clitoria ternatea]|uniref:Uncharacterized protein n=1 Tax=Clitoria ternatea TaxID=43366 RepID=A0AAN9EV05_CLITE